MRGDDLLRWLASLPPRARDAAIEARLGLEGPRPSHAPPGPDLIGYHASGVAAIVRAITAVPVRSDDVVIDLGSGLGKVVLLAHLFTGARARGVELQAELVARAREGARRLDADVAFAHGDARDADLRDGTVFFLYAPFTGRALREAMARLHEVAVDHPIVVCALGVDVERAAPWLAPRPSDAFWLTILDSASPRASAPMTPHARAVALERPLESA